MNEFSLANSPYCHIIPYFAVFRRCRCYHLQQHNMDNKTRSIEIPLSSLQLVRRGGVVQKPNQRTLRNSLSRRMAGRLFSDFGAFFCYFSAVAGSYHQQQQNMYNKTRPIKTYCPVYNSTKAKSGLSRIYCRENNERNGLLSFLS